MAHSKKLMVEVGAFDGTDSLRYHSQGYRVIAFEPKRDLFAALEESTKDKPDYLAVNKAVSLVDGMVTFNLCRHGGASSILPFKPSEELDRHWNRRADVHYSGTSYEVESTRLDTFITEHGLENDTIDYLHVDAQGADLDVLKSLGRFIRNVKEGVIESAYSAQKTIYIGQDNTLCTATQWLNDNGFRVVKVTSNDGTHCECNIYFEREDTV